MGDHDQRHEKRFPFGRPFQAGSSPQQPGRRERDEQADDASRNGSVNGGGGVPPAVPPRVLPFPAARAGAHRAPEPPSEEDLADEFDEPIDLVAVQADDELINALAEGMTVSAPGHLGYDVDDRLVAMLAAWKAEVEADPLPELVDVDQAIAAIDEGKAAAAPPSRFAAWRKAAHGHRFIVPAAVAAAVLVFSFGGVSIGAADAQPGDPLFGVTRVLYSETAESREAAVAAKEHIAQVNSKLAAGDTAGAQREIEALEPLLDKVAPAEGHTYLAAEQSFLAAKISETPPNTPTDPNAPLSDGTPRPTDPTSQNPVVPPPGGSSSPSGSTQPSSGSATPSSSADPRALNTPPSGSSAPGSSSSVPPASSTSPTPVTEGKPDPSTTTAPSSSASAASPSSSTGATGSAQSSSFRSSSASSSGFSTASGSSSAATSSGFTTASSSFRSSSASATATSTTS